MTTAGPATPESEPTVIDALAALRADGYGVDFSVAPGGMLRCGACGAEHAPADATVDRIFRVEGESDPADEAIIFGLTCRACATKGTLVTAYGASVDDDEALVVTGLTTRRP